MKWLNHFPEKMTGRIICREGCVFWLPLQNFCSDCPRHVLREEDAFPRSASSCRRHMLPHDGIQPQFIAEWSEYFMAIPNGKIIDERTLGGRTDSFLLVALVRLPMKCLSCGKGTIFIVAAGCQAWVHGSRHGDPCLLEGFAALSCQLKAP